MRVFGKKVWGNAVPALLCILLFAACGGKQRPGIDLSGSAEPDKVLFERALKDIEDGKHTVGRLTLQTLMNTYPDSEYLAKAKLAIGDSHYKEGGMAGLSQAVAEYKDFITFFPFLDEAAYAQYRVGMAHYRRMQKPDRDRTYARHAEEEFQAFLLKHADHPLAAEAEQRLREVQEVLAEGEFRIARYYYIKGSGRAAGGRLLELVDRYPLYSQGDRALWMLGDLYEKSERGDVAAQFYSRIIKNFPLSENVDNAKERLIALGVPVPQPDPEALARAQKEREMERDAPGLLRKALGALKSGPDVSMAARVGQPNLSPPAEPGGDVETLIPGSGSTIGAGSSAIQVGVIEGNPGNPATPNNPKAADEKESSSKKKDEKDKKKKDEKKKPNT